MASGDKSLQRIERQIDAIEEQVKQMRHSLKTYAANPKKYEPQLENLAQAASYAQRSSEIILRTLGVAGD